MLVSEGKDNEFVPPHRLQQFPLWPPEPPAFTSNKKILFHQKSPDKKLIGLGINHLHCTSEKSFFCDTPCHKGG
jgi:hypothetical protein